MNANIETNLPCANCGRELIDEDLTEDGIGTRVTVQDATGGFTFAGAGAVVTMPGYECPDCGHRGML